MRATGASIGILIFSTILFNFSRWYINPIPILFVIYPPVITANLFPMIYEYYYLYSRGMTQKEKVSRDRYASTSKKEDGR